MGKRHVPAVPKSTMDMRTVAPTKFRCRNGLTESCPCSFGLFLNTHLAVFTVPKMKSKNIKYHTAL
jgi:hypothetical protein